ncbi:MULTISPECIES: peptidase inhibitor family I36 protein [Streptomyces]|uniref:peptidase inhibitor family I36 protein n=1 Tax=Streptomyces TaxID=1883 RepID=UPI000AE48216|nr:MULTISPECIES: peptidase inhibitor family I36 protein [Streptomyces]
MHLRKITSIGATILIAGGIAVGTAAPANAATACPSSGVACLWYNSDYEGGIYVQGASLSDYAGYYFSTSTAPNGSNGSGQEVKNNAASVTNRSTFYRFRVYYNSGWDGSYAYQTIGISSRANLNATMKNENASGAFVD